MYLPKYFQESRPEVLHALMRGRPLATLVTLCDSGIVANHIPVETLAEPGPLGSIRGHIARANPLWKEYRVDTEVLAIFQGPQAYISPSFYPSKQQTGEVVPTWDYAVVHARGTLRFVHDAQWLHALVTRLSDSHEAPRREPWKVGDAPPPYIEKMLSMIVGFEFGIASLTGKWKISQNHPAANRLGVVKGLHAAINADSQEIADMLASFDAASDAASSEESAPASVGAGVIDTERLMLRKLDLSDTEFILELLNEPGFLRFIGDKGVRTLGDAREYLRRGPIDSYDRHGFGLYLTSLRDGTPVGICGLVKRDGLSDVDVGFAFLSRHQSNGYAVESASAVLSHARRELNLQRIVAITSPDNVASIAVLEKIGLAFEGMVSLADGGPALKLFGPIQARDHS